MGLHTRSVFMAIENLLGSRTSVTAIVELA
jgi:hypothetical protein